MFRDPADGRDYLLVAASIAWRSRFAGAVALAGPRSEGAYYLFFSTQRWQAEASGARATFGGTVAPILHLTLNGTNGTVADQSWALS